MDKVIQSTSEPNPAPASEASVAAPQSAPSASPASFTAPQRTEAIRIRGIVQGVGFRPTVYRLAIQCGLVGEVCNDGDGVLLVVQGAVEQIYQFVERLQAECPPLARIDSIERRLDAGDRSFECFTILESVQSGVNTAIAPDAATCPDCMAETLDPASRFYRYPFTNCTHCGPRLSIIRAIPYDRAHTSMAAFPMCPACAQDYGTLENRRFHAQPVACPRCGPSVSLERSDGTAIAAHSLSDLDDVDAVCTLLQQGKIVAIKGLGGMHLACDATDEAAVRTLRQRKRRFHKPFALMARDLAIVEQYCIVGDRERHLLQSPAAPIVLLDVRPLSPDGSPPRPAIAPAVAPGLNTLGFMLPYTPLHHLMLQRLNRPIVLTSGNLSDEPQCIENQEAQTKLSSLADYLLLHNRAIANRVDDSVVRVIRDEPQVLRRARGYAPAPIPLPPGFESAPPILAMGSELKNTFCLLQSGQAILSQHLGDLEEASALAAYRETLNLYLHLFDPHLQAIALDQHPDYLSSKLGQELAEANQLPLHPIQHHHAHVAACMVDNGLPRTTKPVLGIALDGLGYGDDRTFWGGEFLLADYQTYRRVGTFKPIALLGGAQASYQPWRNAYAHLMAAFDWDDLNAAYGHLDLLQFLKQQPRSVLNQMLLKGINAPLASSCGRLFDAIAAAVGICRETASYEGQGAIELEALITPESLNQAEQSPYSFLIKHLYLQRSHPIPYLEPRPLWRQVLADLDQNVSAANISARFHLGLADAIAQMVFQLRMHHDFSQVALTGGVFQNRMLLEQVRDRLLIEGFMPLVHHHVPANDGGLALGQVAIAAARRIPI